MPCHAGVKTPDVDARKCTLDGIEGPLEAPRQGDFVAFQPLSYDSRIRCITRGKDGSLVLAARVRKIHTATTESAILDETSTASVGFVRTGRDSCCHNAALLDRLLVQGRVSIAPGIGTNQACRATLGNPDGAPIIANTIHRFDDNRNGIEDRSEDRVEVFLEVSCTRGGAADKGTCLVTGSLLRTRTQVEDGITDEKPVDSVSFTKPPSTSAQSGISKGVDRLLGDDEHRHFDLQCSAGIVIERASTRAKAAAEVSAAVPETRADLGMITGQLNAVDTDDRLKVELRRLQGEE